MFIAAMFDFRGEKFSWVKIQLQQGGLGLESLHTAHSEYMIIFGTNFYEFDFSTCELSMQCQPAVLILRY